MPRTRISIVLYLILVFASGIMVGIVSHRLYATNTASANNTPQSMTEFRKRYLDGMRTKVGASEDQIVAITRTLDDTKRKFDALAAEEQPLHDKIQQEHVDQVKALLNEKQQIAYDNWRAERERAKLQANQNKPKQKK
jgi:predicted secreted Zn-dependent protease